MLSIVLDLKERNSRDKFFFSNESLLNEIVIDVINSIEKVFENITIYCLGNTPPVINNDRIRVLNEGNHAKQENNGIVEQIFVTLSTIVSKCNIAEGTILYINPFRGAVTSKRLSSINIQPDQHQVVVAAHKTSANVHPLWITPVDKTCSKKQSFVLDPVNARQTLQDDTTLFKVLQKNTSHIAGSQDLDHVYMIDGSMLLVTLETLLAIDNDQYQLKPIIVDGNEELPWYYSIPIFSMAKDSPIHNHTTHFNSSVFSK